nr:MAG: hypothetical protein 3 [Leviviridae sp.]
MQMSLDLDLSVERDVDTIRHRCEHEGLSFLTITLPQLSDALERGLEAGTFTCPTSFSRHGSLPRFMGGFFKRVFDKDGGLLPSPCPYTIAGIRQVCRFFKKLKLECSRKRNRKAEEHFLEVEGELRRETPFIEREDNVLDKVSGIIWSRVFPEIDYVDLVCHHGPGFTADRRLPNERHRISEWNHRSELTFPSDLHCFPNYGYAAEASGTGEGIASVEGPIYRNLRSESGVRVVFVPKTQTAPRVIAIEPSHMQYMQQSLKDYVYKQLETHSLTKRSIRFARQDVNQRLAHRSSIDKSLATLDLKDASDRVHLHLVQRIFKTSGILEYLEDARSLHATLPSKRNIVLFKYASMGSALCFPVEAMVFYTLIQSAMHQLDGRRPSSRSVRDYSRLIDVYGDDIIVPVEYADVVVRYLESYALKVNVNKSFKSSHFRESCGADYYNGYPVNPVYARMYPPDNSQHWGAAELMSWNATADLFYMRGQWLVAQAIRDMLHRVTRRAIPRSRSLGGGLVHYSLIYDTRLRYSDRLHGWEQKRTIFQPLKQKDEIDGNDLACLNKWALSMFASKHGSYRFGTPPMPVISDRITRKRSLDGGPTDHYSECGVRLAPTEADSCVAKCGMVSISRARTDERDEPSLHSGLRDVAEQLHQGRSLSTRQEETLQLNYCLAEDLARDPLYYLDGREEGLDFLTSTKRGGFKSKRRWVGLLTHWA